MPKSPGETHRYPQNVLSVSSLRFAYGSRVAVDDVSFSLKPGEILGLLGPNGAGKTTTLSCLAGLLEPAAGELAFCGAQFLPWSRPKDRARLGVVPQELALYGRLAARENLELFGKLAGLPPAALGDAIDRVLDLAGLADRATDRVSTYSGGMKRRLNLAVGEIATPDLLLLDEPTVGVDPQSRNHIFETLEKLRGTGRSILYTTHYMEEAERLCNRVAILDQGKILDIGTPAELADRAGVPGADLERVFLERTGRALRDGS